MKASFVAYKPRLKKALHIVGGLLALASLYFVGQKLYHDRHDIDLSQLSAQFVIVLIVLGGVIGMANICLALAWHALLRYKSIAVTRRWSITTYGLSQLAKYVPGNIAHLAGRQALAVAAGLPGWRLAGVMVLELAIQAVAASVFGLLVLPLIVPGIPAWLAAGLFLLATLGGGFAVRRVSRDIAMALLYNGGFLAASASVFVVILLALMPSPLSVGWLVAIGSSFVIAWLIGFVTPGAPAGIGVRELVLLTLLGAHLPEQPLLLAVVLSRLVTVGGDLLYFALVGVARLYHHQETTP
ncbi:hypothetical protein [Halomonas llamarensis]|uniref:Flippase-like domain-containing protein n=1 Tax=Halomonas llamarensis TaxID=2945104 RepID=A0ABT0SP58_9GAMM|nr:hypothetical protein [Halomonas llamarensis]MCL7929592.1 hypothetical protein [Halomonas llamarensis]